MTDIIPKISFVSFRSFIFRGLRILFISLLLESIFHPSFRVRCLIAGRHNLLSLGCIKVTTPYRNSGFGAKLVKGGFHFFCWPRRHGSHYNFFMIYLYLLHFLLPF